MRKLILIILCIFMVSFAAAAFTGYSPDDGHLAVHFIDVGQGDAIFIQTADSNILIDGGDRGNIVPDYLQSRGIETIHIMIGTHPHADHIGGLINVLRELEVIEVIDPAVVHTTRTFEDYLTLIDQNDVIFTVGRAGMTREIGPGIHMDILHPEDPSNAHLNDASVVAKVTYGNISFLFTGDAEIHSEREMLNRASSSQDLKSTILKIGHHGSRTSTSPPFLDAVNPEVAVILTGEGNRYGHPHEETMRLLSMRAIEIYRTDLHGNIIISTDGINYHIDVNEPYTYDREGTADFGININTADMQRLQDIIHISEARARQLIALRPFHSLDQLSRISGIGSARLQEIKNQGLAYVE